MTFEPQDPEYVSKDFSICEDCEGRGFLDIEDELTGPKPQCPVCKGTGKSYLECERCGGDGIIGFDGIGSGEAECPLCKGTGIGEKP